MNKSFTHENITLINADCMEVMKDFGDGYFELAVVDPPYGKGISNYSEIGYNGFNVFAPKEWDNAIPDNGYFLKLFRVSRHQIIWGGNYFPLPPKKGFIIWDKGEGFKNRTYAECEYAWTSIDKNAKVYKRDPLAKGDYKGKIHINQKPVALYSMVLEDFAKPTDKILDTHGGSFSSAIAAYRFGCKEFIGIEKDPDYFHAAVKRFKQQVSQLDIFRDGSPREGKKNGHEIIQTKLF